MFRRTTSAAALVVSMIVLLLGCTANPPVDTAAVERPAVDVPAHAMSMERKSTELAEGFPFQVPVFDAIVTGTQVVTPGSVWGYDLEAAEPVDLVSEWYRLAYAGANWVLDREERLSGADSQGVVLYLFKGAGAQSIITVRELGEDASSVSGTVGLGAGLGDTF
ncbi:MAG: hypothetical protein RQ731_08240 [Anaerosomatales bacterium]|nr:hypothetical protein [Anaerosomatales bacterium]MDT8434727.1 hypothetical protein [Anaerosomatales bacterium]